MKKNPILIYFIFANTMWIIFIVIINALSGFTRAVGASYIQQIVDSLNTAFTAPVFFWKLIVVGCTIMLSSYIFRWLSSVAARYMAEKLSLETRLQLVEHLKKISFLNFEHFKIGDLQSIIRNYAAEAAELIYNLFSRIMNNIFLFGFSVWYMAMINVLMTVVVVVVILIIAGINQFILAQLKKHFKATRQSLGKLSAHVENIYSCMDTIKTYWVKDYVLDLFKHERHDYNSHVYNTEAIDAGRLSLYNTINNLSLFTAVIYLGFKGISGDLSIGSSVAYIYMIKQILVPVEVIFRWMGRIIASNTSWERVYSILHLPIDEMPVAVNSSKTANYAEVRNLSFHYDNSNDIFENLHIEMKKRAY